MKVLLIGNYGPDRQQSMQRYAQLVYDGLREAEHEVTLAVPRAVFNSASRGASGVWKWVGYVDKLVVAPRELARAASNADVVHVCDHSNAVYVPRNSPRPYVVTCHDLLAVRGALGEDTDCPASFTGRQLQKEILSGLRRAQAVACVSGATLKDAQRLLGKFPGQLHVVPNGLNYPYRPLEAAEIERRLAHVVELRNHVPYVLQVGSSLRRKNRECTLRALADIASSWPGKIVFAGQPLGEELGGLASRLGIADRVVEVIGASNAVLEALYGGALAMIFPSRFEGFGWPIIEAQACGCPVICSDREPFPEIAGGAAIHCDADDHAAFGRAILELTGNAQRRQDLVSLGLRNAARFDRSAMIEQFVALYEQVAARA